MSSGDNSKPTANPPAGREDNPFDITKRPQHEVAAEIASRLASWKQARNRSNPTAAQATDPSRAVDAGSSDAKQPSEQSPLAPVQPQVPKSASHAAHSIVNEPRPADPAPARPHSSGDREPLAPFAMRRAMPPAPSPRRAAQAAEGVTADPLDRAPALDSTGEPTVRPPVNRPPRVDLEIERPAASRTDKRSAALPPAESVDVRIEPRLAVPESAPREASAPRAEPRIDTARAEAPSAEAPWAKALRIEQDRIEPTFDRVARRAGDHPGHAAPRRDGGEHPGLPWMMTRLERQERSVPPSMPAPPRASTQRRGSGWAIGLGAVLLLIGVTSPAAIWQHWRMTMPTRFDQIATTPAPDSSGQDSNVQATAQPTPTEPAHPTTQPAPNAASNAPAPQQQPSADTANQQQAANAPATTLAAIGEGSELSEAPITAPPQPETDTTTAAGPAPAPRAFSPRPFRTDQAGRPFQQAARPFQPGQATPFHSLPAPLVLKPNLSARLKPQQEQEASVLVPPAPKVASSTSQRAAKPGIPRSTAPQSLDQMFQTLINELASGRPMERQRQAGDPSNRR